MKTEFKFSNLLGTVYNRGNLLFTPDGSCLLSPVGNRVTVFDLVRNRSYTLPFAHRRRIARITLAPRGNLLLTVDEDGRAILSNFPKRIALYHFSFRSPVTALVFSPSGRHFAAGVGRHVEVWRTPSAPEASADGALEFAPFVRHRVYAGHHDTVTNIEWSGDSRFFLSTSKDLTARIWSIDPEEGFEPTTLAGHRESVLASWFSKDQERVITISRDGALFQWQYRKRHQAGDEDEMTDDSDERWRISSKHFFMRTPAKVTCAAYHADSELLVVGFSDGMFKLYELPDFNEIHALSISQSDIDFVTINSTGEWLAFGASKLGQLLVWEWQSESYILKQQNHFDAINAITYSPDGQRAVTAADDGKIKVWDVASGFCIVTFSEHSASVSAAQFAKRGNVLFTASLDGSVRAWDLIRFRNFRTFTAPSRLSFTSLAVDPSGEVVAAGSQDSYDIHIWSVQTGQLLDQLSGHEAPVSSLAFAPDGSNLLSGSWDHTVRVWDIFSRKQTSEPLDLQSEVLCVAYRPDSKQIAASSLNGQISFWDVSDAAQQSGIDARRDVSGGRKIGDRRTAANSEGTKAVNSIVYSADGSCILAGGNSKYVCLYEVVSGSLVKKFTISINLSLNGTQEYLNSRNLTEAGPANLIDTTGDASDLEDRLDRKMPGAARGDMSLRKTLPAVRVTSVSFSPNAREFIVASTEGLHVFSLDTALQFDPFNLDIEITPATTLAALEQKDYVTALVMSFRLNLAAIIRRVYFSISAENISIVVKQVPIVYLPRLLRFVAKMTEETPHFEFNLLWIKALINAHGLRLKEHQGLLSSELRMLQRTVERVRGDLKRLADDNGYNVTYLLEQPQRKESSTDGVLGGQMEWIGAD